MSLSIRRLDPDTDRHLFVEAQQWSDAGPCWLRGDVLGDPTNPNWASVGVFVDGVFVADMTLVLQAPHTYEVHLDAKRGTSVDVLIEAGRSIRDQMLSYGMQTAFVWIPRQHHAVKAITKAIGFANDCVSMFTSDGRLVEYQRYSLRSTDVS